MIFLLRLGDERRWIRYSLAAFFIFNLGHMVAVFVGVLIQCLPLAMYWDHPHTDQVIDGEIYNPHYSCINTEAFFMSTASISILTDLFTLIVPIFLVWPLNLKRHRKFAVGAVLSLGWIVLIVSTIRLKKFYDLWNAPSQDPTYSLDSTISVVEVNVAIILCCGPPSTPWSPALDPDSSHREEQPDRVGTLLSFHPDSKCAQDSRSDSVYLWSTAL